ncbi:MAG: hypothetical protein HQK70_04550 [Desulfamplus sp.]|nr:hypothetical protein [Desulfamplus sp.]
MTKKTPLEKRVKRRITARSHRFFAVCSPGLKQLCYREMTALINKYNHQTNDSHQLESDLLKSELSIQFRDIEIIPGGVEFTGSVQDCYCANLYLRSPSRILMRIATFKAENFRTLEKKMGEIEWELYINQSLPLHFEVSAKSSRLYHTDAIAQRAHQVIKEHFSKLSNIYVSLDNPAVPKIVQTIMIRAEDDSFQISIDSSGELLHKRGLKENVGSAPIRETLAFAVLSAMNYPFGYNKSDNLYNSNQLFKSSTNRIDNLPLIDGMCGSGTFALEAAMIANDIPAGFFRRFAFENWQCFSSRQWNHIKKIAATNIIDSDKDGGSQHPFIFALDKDAAVLKGLERTVEIFNLSSSIKIIQGNFFDTKTINLSDNKGFVVLNPPYGKRIGEKGDSEQIFVDIGKKLQSDFKGWQAGVIIPDKKFLDHLPGRKSLIPIFHGGLEIYAAIIQI